MKSRRLALCVMLPLFSSAACAPGLVPNPYINTDAGTIWLCSTNGVWVQIGQVGPTSSTVQGNGPGKPTTFTTARVAGNVPAGGTAGQMLTSTGSASAWSSRPTLDGVGVLVSAAGLWARNDTGRNPF